MHFVGRVPYAALIRLLQFSAAHIYLTYLFVLSWSVLDATNAGVLVVGLRTPHVEKVISHRWNGLLANFHDVDGIAEAVAGALAAPELFAFLSRALRETVRTRYDLRWVCPSAWLGLMGDTAGQTASEPTEGLVHA